MSNAGKLRNSLLLLLAAAIWGFAFAFQRMGGEAMGAFTMNALRSFIGVATILAVLRISGTKLQTDKTTIRGGILCGLVLTAACNLQQFGLLYTSPGKAGFITASYMIIVAVISLFKKKKPGLVVLLSVILGITGLYLICMPDGEDLRINKGDLLCMACAFCFAIQIIIIDTIGEKAESVKMCAIQFLVVGVLSGIPALLFEHPTAACIRDGIVPLLYVGMLSTGVAYSLQMVGMIGIDPSVSSLIMSLESVFSVIGEFVILGTAPGGKALTGCGIMFAAILLSQFDTFKKR